MHTHGHMAQCIVMRETHSFVRACSARVAVAQGSAGCPAGCTYMRGMGVDRYCTTWESCSRTSSRSLPSTLSSLPAPAACLQDLRGLGCGQAAHSLLYAHHHPLQHRCRPGGAWDWVQETKAVCMPRPEMEACIRLAQQLCSTSLSLPSYTTCKIWRWQGSR